MCINLASCLPSHIIILKNYLGKKVYTRRNEAVKETKSLKQVLRLLCIAKYGHVGLLPNYLKIHRMNFIETLEVITEYALTNLMLLESTHSNGEGGY